MYDKKIMKTLYKIDFCFVSNNERWTNVIERFFSLPLPCELRGFTWYNVYISISTKSTLTYILSFSFQDLCFHYVWNNFLHTHVSQCVNTILYNSPVEVDGKKEHLLLAQVLLKQLSLYSVLIVRKGCELWVFLKLWSGMNWEMMYVFNFCFQLFTDCNLLQRMMEVWEENDQQQ